jgi:glutamate dehydrogenase/leucine dehydrogenase
MNQAILIGGIVGAAAGYLCSQAETEPDKIQAEIDKYSFLRRNAAMVSSLAEPLALFLKADEEAATQLLKDMDALCRFYAEANATGKPVVLAKSLGTKRAAAAGLQRLTRVCRRKHPFQAGELQEDFAAISKALEDCAHNISMEQAYQIMEPKDLTHS